jgi:aldehyde:ferredoxin oxidoreductase
MGSKNLKAIAVRGTGRVEVYDIKMWREFVREIIRKEIMENPATEAIRKVGTPNIVDLSNNVGILPTRNFQNGVFEHANDINWDAIKENIFLKKTACHKCPMACRNIVKVRSGPFKGLTIEGPEYETLALAGSNCGVRDLKAIVKFNSLCDDLGLDTISTGNVTAFAMECFEKGIITRKETGGLELKFGSVENYLEIPSLIANRKGIGGILAHGVKKASEKIKKGCDYFALHVKGLEYPGYDPRGSFGMALAYATSDRGACHMRAWPVGYDAFGTLNPFTHEGKAKLCIDDQNLNSIKWSFIFCDFYPIGYPTMARFYYLATGRGLSEEDLMLIGERIWNLVRVFNVREGFTRKDDTLPARIAKDPLISGPPKGKFLPKELFEKMLDEYYELRGWNKNGIPTVETLRRLGLADLVKDIKQYVEK